MGYQGKQCLFHIENLLKPIDLDSLNLNGRRVYNLSSLEVEDIVKLILEEKLDRGYFVQKIRALYPDNSVSDPIVQKIGFAFGRITKPLSLEEKITFLVIPFGIANRFAANYLFDVEKELNMGFKKRVNDYLKYSTIGLFSYFILVFLLIYFF